MPDTRSVAELQVWEIERIVRDIPRDYFMEAVREYTRQLGEELTGKDITQTADRRCIRSTFEHSQQCRLDRADTKKTVKAELLKLMISAVTGAGGSLGAVWLWLQR